MRKSVAYSVEIKEVKVTSMVNGNMYEITYSHQGSDLAQEELDKEITLEIHRLLKLYKIDRIKVETV